MDMTSEERLDELWREMEKLDAEYELAERGLNMVVESFGMSSPEAVEAAQYLDKLGARLLKMDAEYTARLKWTGWLWE